jgi:DNA modification methylase
MTENRVLHEIYTAPPISVLDVKQKYWKDKKKQWLKIGIQSEIGRSDNLLSLSDLMRKKQKGTSIFDPVLCECIYRWFSEKNDTIFDPFSGGSVRGVVASKLERNYIGYEIRKIQVDSNKQQAHEICGSHIPEWKNVSVLDYEAPDHDLFFTCPPYYNLEKYSNDDRDLSIMTPEEFDTNYVEILKKSLDKLRNDRFAVIVVGDVRDKKGFYMKLPQKTVGFFESCGLILYNDMVLLQEPATAAMRANRYMNSSRKIAKCHQNVLVFVKGDPIKATKRMKSF